MNKCICRNKNLVELIVEIFLFFGFFDISDVFWMKNEKIIVI